MNTQELQVIDTTDGDADTWSDTVIIHDTVSGQPSIISYDWDIAEALEELAGPLPEEYKYLPEEYENAWVCENDQGVLDGFASALGARIEDFKEFLKENSGVWTAPGGRIVKDEPTWVYPDNVMKNQPRNSLSTTQE